MIRSKDVSNVSRYHTAVVRIPVETTEALRKTSN